MAKLIGRERWAADRRFDHFSGRLRYHDEIDQGISAWTEQYSSKDAEERLRAAGICAERVRRIDEVVDGADSATVFPMMAEPRVGSMRTTALPFSLSCVDLPAPFRAPRLGEHSTEVLRAWLNCSDTEITELKQHEVLQ